MWMNIVFFRHSQTVQLQLSRQGAVDNPDDACQKQQVEELKEK